MCCYFIASNGESVSCLCALDYSFFYGVVNYTVALEKHNRKKKVFIHSKQGEHLNRHVLKKMLATIENISKNTPLLQYYMN